MISGFSSLASTILGFVGEASSGPAGNFRQNGTQLVLLEYHAASRLTTCAKVTSSTKRRSEARAGRQPKSPAFENREDRGSLGSGGFHEHSEGVGQPPSRRHPHCTLELEVSRGSARTAVSSRGWEQTHHTPQVFPRSLVERWVCADQVANHLPRGDVESAFGRWAHGQRD
jgi:hypothetical protein